MGKKRRLEQPAAAGNSSSHAAVVDENLGGQNADDIHVVEDRLPVGFGGRNGAAGEAGLAGAPAAGSRVEPETVAYLQDVVAHAATLDDDEERALLLSNVLEEIGGREQRIASDAVTSRLLEALLAGAPVQQLLAFLGAFTNEDAMYALAGRCGYEHPDLPVARRLKM